MYLYVPYKDQDSLPVFDTVLKRITVRGSIVGTVLGALIFGVIISGFTFLRIDAYYQEMIKGVIIVVAVVADVARQRKRSRS